MLRHTSKLGRVSSGWSPNSSKWLGRPYGLPRGQIELQVSHARGVHREPEARLALGERRVRPLALGDVHPGTDDFQGHVPPRRATGASRRAPRTSFRPCAGIDTPAAGDRARTAWGARPARARGRRDGCSRPTRSRRARPARSWPVSLVTLSLVHGCSSVAVLHRQRVDDGGAGRKRIAGAAPRRAPVCRRSLLCSMACRTAVPRRVSRSLMR